MSKLLEQINTLNKTGGTLSSLIDLIGGGTPKTTVKEYWNGDIPWLSVVDFNNDSRWVSDAEKKITEEGVQNSSTRILEKSDIIISARGTVGVLAQLSRPMAFNQSCYGIRAKDGVNQDYLFYLLKASIPKLTQIVHGAVFDTITKDSFEQINVSVPDLPTQKKIASILSAYDTKIENNNKIIKNLETTAQTIFNEWFVNFKFPGYEKVKMVDSEMGEIPEGWEIKNVLDVIERISPGKKYDNKSASPSGRVPILDQGASGFIGYHDDEPGVVASIDNPVVVFTNHTCYYRILTEPFSCIQNVLPYIGKNGYDTFFVYFLTKEKIKMSEYKGHWPEFEQQVFVIPTPEIATQFSKMAKVFIEKIVTCEKENVSLKSQRDRLLARLI